MLKKVLSAEKYQKLKKTDSLKVMSSSFLRYTLGVGFFTVIVRKLNKKDLSVYQQK
jgi:hypothetical protein